MKTSNEKMIRDNPLPKFYFPLNCAGRFSRNADVPSFLSSVAHDIANSTASR